MEIGELEGGFRDVCAVLHDLATVAVIFWERLCHNDVLETVMERTTGEQFEDIFLIAAFGVYTEKCFAEAARTWKFRMISSNTSLNGLSFDRGK